MSEKREKIIQASLKLFTQKGIDSTSTASIAKEAGVGTGTVFHHYSNKDELINECFKYVKEKLREALQEIDSDDFVDKAHAYWKSAVEWYLDNKAEAQFLSIYQHDPKLNNGKSFTITTEISDLVMKVIIEAKEKGIIRDFPIDYFCMLAIESTMLTAQYLLENPDADREKTIRSTCDFFLNGVLNK
ncbi:MAG: hypothetical protein CME64_17030 [Halobacteriovoraceae bacterium]|nr:hypothetical protein [Halobacteriovoraceae bacterium]|tara:strand:+ start:231702 stop:232262 length:561 start_codon:yes stop_codon:yes gene_type:complete